MDRGVIQPFAYFHVSVSFARRKCGAANVIECPVKLGGPKVRQELGENLAVMMWRELTV